MEMTILQAVLCGVVYWLAVGNLPFVGLWSLQRPLVCGAISYALAKREQKPQDCREGSGAGEE